MWHPKLTGFKHGYAKAGGKSSTYRSWTSMRQRCLNPNDKNWKDYGGRGITICEEWMDYKNLFKDMGEKPKGMRKDVMRFVKSAICFVIGHKWNEVALNHGYADCERCNYGQPCGPTEPFTIQNWLWWRRYYLGKFYRNLKYRISGKNKAWRKPDDLDLPF